MKGEHLATCVCNDCLPGGKREHRVRPYGGVAEKDCEHGGPEWHQATLPGRATQALARYRVPLIGGGSVLLCRLCGKVLEKVTP